MSCRCPSLITLALTLAVLLLAAPAPHAETTDPASFVSTDPISQEPVVTVPDHWQSLPPFDQRFGVPRRASDTHVIDLAAYRFETDPLVSGSRGDRTFRAPDTSMFPQRLIVLPFRHFDRDYFIVQAESPEAQGRIRQLAHEHDLDIVAYLPNMAYLLRLDKPAFRRLGTVPEVFWAGLYQPAWRVSPYLDFIIEANAEHPVQLVAQFDRRPHLSGQQVLDRLADIGVVAHDIVERDASWKVRIDRALAEQARDIALLPGCLWVERWVPFELHNNMARTSSDVPTGRGASSGPIMDVEDVWARGIRGEGQIAAASDSGLSTGDLSTLHSDFGEQGSSTNPMRVIAAYALGRTGDWSDDQSQGGGHGTHTSGSIVANGVSSGADPSTNSFPSSSYAGTAPKAELVFQSVMDRFGNLGGIPSDIYTLFQTPYTDGARVHSNSWGAPNYGQYNTDSQRLDDFVWDNPDMVITFSAGNSGEDSDSSGVIDTDSVGTPGTAKNCITVGASENYRPDFVYESSPGDCTSGDGFTQMAWGWGWPSSFPSSPIYEDLFADDASGLGAFSSRGPTDDERFKPDIVAPGIAIISTRTDENQDYEQWGICPVPSAYRSFYVTQGGTSMSNPLTAGAATLVRQYYADGWHANGSPATNSAPDPGDAFNPSAALVKATLIHGAWDMTPGQYGTGADQEVPPGWDGLNDLPNNAQGYGRVDLESSLFPGSGWGDHASRTMTVQDVSAGLTTGDSDSYSLDVGSAAAPLVVTLTWTDPSASTGAGTKLVNDLDLVVTSPGGTRYYPNRKDWTGGPQDSSNNVEQVYVSSPPVGLWQIRVDGTSIPGNGDAGTTSQPYALVYSAVSCVAPSPPATVAASATADNEITVSWSAVSGIDTYHVYRSLDGGPSTWLADVTPPTTSYADRTVSGSIDYTYRVTTEDSCSESALSDPATATATGPCNLAPTFAGIETATANASCGIDLAWSAATAHCGGPVTYTVYRAASSPVSPTAGNRIALGITGTSYADGAGLAAGSPYYYLVRAVDGTNSIEDANSNEASASVSADSVPIDEDFATGDPPSGWSVDDGGTGSQHWTTSNPGSRSIPSPLATPVMIIDSDADGWSQSQDDSLRTPTFSTAGGSSVVLEFDHYYNFYSSDTAEVDYSTDGGSTWTTLESWSSDQGPEHYSRDITAQVGGSETVQIRFHYTGSYDWYWMVDNVTVTVSASCTSSPGPVEYLTVRSTHQTNDLQWMTPDVGMYGRTRICWDTSSFPSDPDACASSHDDTATGQGAHASWSHSGLSNDVTYRYAVWADDGNDATSDWSSVTQVTGRPENTSDPANPVHWVYTTTASSLAPPGIGSAYAVSNDRVLHSVVDGSSGGTWPAAWEPVPMNAPSQQRPAVVVFDDTPGPSGAAKVVFMSSQDGRVYAADADSGAVLWTSVDLGMVQAAPSAIFSEFGGAHDLVFVGTRNALSDNRLVALNVSDGSTAWEFENSAAQGGDGTGIGIISGQPAVSYATNRVYFTSRERAGGSADTVWCLSFTGNGVDDVQLEWSQAAGSIDAGPSMRDGVVYVGTNDSEVHAFDASGGAALWATPFDCSDGPIKGFPWLRSDPGGTLLFLSTTSTVWRLQDGGSSPSCAWSTSAHPQCPVTAPSVGSPSVPLLVPGTNDLLVGSSDGRLHQLSISDGSASASPLVLGDGTAVVGSPSLDTRNDLAYVGTEAGSLYAVTAPFSKKGGALR